MPYSHASVVKTRQLSARLRRIVLEVDEPAELGIRAAGDSAVGVYFAPEDHPEGEGRNYSVRRHDGALIALDVVLHSQGPGATWASSATPGQRVILDHARSWYRPPPDTQWQLLVSDLSGLPAAARIVEELPARPPATLIVEIPTTEELDYLPRHPGVTVIPRVGSGNGPTPSALAEAVREHRLPAGRGYCWFAGEAAESRAVRKHLRGMGWTIDQYDVTGYWRRDSKYWDAKFAEVGDDALAVYERALADGKGDKSAFEEFDDACERIGL
ncbi:siderophore-interacting protein [Mycolicibacterium psychrotolerans]|uniref:Siderophore-interacting protein n=1 Tax=Mycolicibacterium psychrotolerans TaxID=216929 RepID=A0A7I7MED4_9MYCO|nr:siderophore-interacting protein [Mycolicibacterium psychrotolerans]BBX69883.1 siderophore-interacting protein [Mycolicibacterium psychrotolerans]